jgi:hypothetical protein
MNLAGFVYTVLAQVWRERSFGNEGVATRREGMSPLDVLELWLVLLQAVIRQADARERSARALRGGGGMTSGST